MAAVFFKHKSARSNPGFPLNRRIKDLASSTLYVLLNGERCGRLKKNVAEDKKPLSVDHKTNVGIVPICTRGLQDRRTDFIC